MPCPLLGGAFSCQLKTKKPGSFLNRAFRLLSSYLARTIDDDLGDKATNDGS